ncbi:MAG: NUDIX domain-containing protein [Pseudonocardia sp.]
MASQEHHPVDVNLAKLAADFAAEGDPEPECNVGIAGRLPRKNVASGALIFNQSHEILFVVPAYKPYLDVPGGMAEDGESPLIACRREVREELGLDLDINRLLLVDWVPTHGIWHDSLQSIYSGGVLDPSQVNRITLSSEEVSDVTFLHLHDAVPKLRPSLARRLETALTALSDMTLKYAEFGRVTTTLKQDHARPP